MVGRYVRPFFHHIFFDDGAFRLQIRWKWKNLSPGVEVVVAQIDLYVWSWGIVLEIVDAPNRLNAFSLLTVLKCVQSCPRDGACDGGFWSDSSGIWCLLNRFLHFSLQSVVRCQVSFVTPLHPSLFLHFLINLDEDDIALKPEPAGEAPRRSYLPSSYYVPNPSLDFLLTCTWDTEGTGSYCYNSPSLELVSKYKNISQTVQYHR
jgi:hypothetical protein